MLNAEKYLPYSNGKYWVNDFGEISDSSGTLAKRLVNGEYVVYLNWVDGLKDYPVALVVVCSHKGIYLPPELIKEIEPLFIDQQRTNTFPTNLIYRFRNGPLPVKEKPGFYYIPYFTRYAINQKGVILSLAKDAVKKIQYTKPGKRNAVGGYAYTSGINDQDISRNILRHRAVGLVFLKYDHTLPNKVINHKNGKPGNDYPDNLEWVSRYENIIHAVRSGLTPISAKAILMWDLDTDKIIRFASISDCARQVGGITRALIEFRLKDGTCKRFENGLIFKFDDGKPWPFKDKSELQICRIGSGVTMEARNVFTGKIIVFEGCAEGEEFTGVNKATILLHVKKDSKVPFGGWNFRYRIRDAKPWPKHSERHLLCYKANPNFPSNGYIAKDINTGEETFYTSYHDVQKQIGLLKTNLSFYVRKKKPYKGKYFSVFDLRKNLV